jgi:hypothetical protein
MNHQNNFNLHDDGFCIINNLLNPDEVQYIKDLSFKNEYNEASNPPALIFVHSLPVPFGSRVHYLRSSIRCAANKCENPSEAKHALAVERWYNSVPEPQARDVNEIDKVETHRHRGRVGACENEKGAFPMAKQRNEGCYSVLLACVYPRDIHTTASKTSRWRSHDQKS